MYFIDELKGRCLSNKRDTNSFPVTSSNYYQLHWPEFLNLKSGYMTWGFDKRLKNEIRILLNWVTFPLRSGISRC